MRNFIVSVAVLLFSFPAFGARKCLRMKDHYHKSPIKLAGRLAVTYINQRITEGDNHEIATMDLKRGPSSFRRLTFNTKNESEVEISPDGKSILYNVRENLDEFTRSSELWQMNWDGTGARPLVGGNESVGVPAWNYPKGESFNYIQWSQTEPAKLLTYDIDSKTVTPFPTDLENTADPEISYDGKLITFKMPTDDDRDFQPSIYVMNSDGSGLKRLTRGWSDHDPVFSKDGKKIYFERYYGPGDWFEASQDRSVPEHNWWGIVEVDVATAKERVLIPHDPCGRHFFWLPTISPDGKSMMYIHVDVKGRVGTDLWVSDLDGKKQQRVRGTNHFYFFDWTE